MANLTCGSFDSRSEYLVWLVVPILFSACGSSSQTLTAPPPARCGVQAQADSSTFPSAGGTGTLRLTTNRECAWSAQSGAAWVKLAGPASGQGDGTVKFTVDPNSDPPARTAAITVNDVRLELSQQGRPCELAVSSERELVEPAGGDRTVRVTATSEQCAWTATAAVPWIAVTAGARGTGSGSVSFHVAAAAGPPRTGTLTIAGHVVHVEQGAGCTYTTPTAAFNLASSGGSLTVPIDTAQDCGWTVQSSVPWITAVSGPGSGSGQAVLAVAANTSPARQASVVVAGQTITVSQAGGCTYAVSPDAYNLPPAGSSGLVTVTTGEGCPWIGTSGAEWISLPVTSGTGSAAVQFTVAPNPGIARTSSLSVAGDTVTVVQASACEFALSPPSMTQEASGGGGAVLVIVSGSCTWSARTDESWITLLSGTSGAGGGLVQFLVAANGGAARDGVIVIAGHAFAVHQAGQ